MATFQAIVDIFEKHRDEAAKEVLAKQERMDAQQAAEAFAAFLKELETRLDKAIDHKMLSTRTAEHIEQMRVRNTELSGWILAQYQSAVVLDLERI